jgi:hypothetical protein
MEGDEIWVKQRDREGRGKRGEVERNKQKVN